MIRRIFVLGVDGLILPLTDRLVADGRLPHIARLFREGSVAKVLPFVSTWGPINWMCFATGAPPGTAWRGTVHVPGIDEADVAPKGAYGAEALWEALARQGRASVVASYPACWPPTAPQITVVVPDGQSTDLGPLQLGRPARYMTPDLVERYRQPPGTQAGWAPLSSRGRRAGPPPALPMPTLPDGWRNLPEGRSLATSFPLLSNRREELTRVDVLLTGLDSAAPQALFCRDRDAAQVMGRAGVDAWSDWASLDLNDREATVRFRLLALSDGGRSLAVCHSEVFPTRGFAYPRAVEGELLSAVGPYASGSSAHLRPTDPFWATAADEALYEAEWLAGAAQHLVARDDAGLFMTVYRPADSANHDCLAYLDPRLPHYGGRDTELAMEILAAAYGAVDRAIGLWLDDASGEDAADETAIVLASDHGAVVNHVTCDIYNLLVDHGLLSLDINADGAVTVNWAETQAYIRPTRSGSEVFVNLRGREPYGVVAPEAYETVQAKVIDLLLDWREPLSGERAVALALRKRDAALLGYWGEEAGDVQFIYNEGFVWGALPPGVTIARTDIPAVNHGPQIPTAERGLASNMGMLALWGPGIRRGYRRPEGWRGPARMTDAAPTIAYLLGLEPPTGSEGAVLVDMLE